MTRSSSLARTVRGALVAVLAAGAIALPAHSAAAAPLPLEFSTDGSSWSTTPPASVFPAELRIVPGDTVSSTIYLRSTRTEPTELSVLLTGVNATDPELASNLTLASTPAPGAGLTATRLDRIAACTPVLVATTVQAYQTVALTITLRMSATVTGTTAQNERAYFNLVAGMSDFGGGAPVAGCGNGPVIPSLPSTGGSVGGGSAGGSKGTAARPRNPLGLPFTGAELLMPSLGVAAAAFTTGLVFVAIARRRRRTEEEAS